MEGWKLRLKVRTTLLIGGQTSPVLVDVATARQPSGVPIIPASAIKGALRIECERLARLAQREGLFPAKPRICNAGSPDSACGMVELCCVVCSLFGSPGIEGKLRFHDAVLVEEQRNLFVAPERREPKRWQVPSGVGYDIRPGVAIGRIRKAAAEQLLFMSEVLTPFMPECVFEADIEVRQQVSSEERRLLQAAVSFLTAIGGDKSRGVGHVEASLVLPSTEDAPTTESIISSPTEQAPEPTPELMTPPPDMQITLEPLEYVRVSAVKVTNNFLDAFDFLPGSTVRGAVARSFKESLAHGFQDEAFREAFLKTPVLLSDFYPTTAARPPKPIPLSFRACKAYPGFQVRSREQAQQQGTRESHGGKDILIAATVVKKLRAMGSPVLLEERCTTCNADLKEWSGYYLFPAQSAGERVQFRMSTKTALNRARGTSAEGQLYSYQLVDNQMEVENGRPRFIGTAVCLTPALHHHLHQLNGQTLLIGGARLRGFGKVQVLVSDRIFPDEESRDACEQRLSQFTKAIMTPLRDAAQGKEGKERLEKRLFFSLTLTSDLILPPGDWNQALREEAKKHLGLQQNLAMELAVCRTGYRGGYNEALGMSKDLLPVIQRGSACVFSCQEDDKGNLLNSVPALLRQGMGLHREEGFGRVSFCDPLHLERQTQS